MKINSIYIHSFGKLKDFSLELGDGLNVVYGDNENGKTTVMAFIRMMFYGTEGKRAHNLASKPRVKYAPWSGGVMGGKIEFEHQNKRYRLEREFKKSDSTDRIVLFDLDLGKEVKFGNLGAEFLGLSAAAFDKSVFIDTFLSASNDKEAEGEINAKLSNAFVSSGEDTSYDTVIRRIESAKNEVISKSKKAGLYAKNEEKLRGLEERLKVSEEKAARRISLDERLKERILSLSPLKAEALRLKELISFEENYKNAQKLKEYLDTKKELDGLKSSVTLTDGNFADEMYIKSLEFCINRLSAQNEKISELKAEYEKLKEEIRLSEDNDTEELTAKLNTSKNLLKKLEDEKQAVQNEIALLEERLFKSKSDKEALITAKKPINIPMFITGLILAAVLGALSGFGAKSLIGTAASVLVGVVLIILSFILKKGNKSAILRADTEINMISVEAASKNASLSAVEGKITAELGNQNLLSSAISMSLSKKEGKLNALKEKEEKLFAETEKQAELKNMLYEVFARLNLKPDFADIPEALEGIKKTAEQIKALKLKLKYLSDDLGGISYEDAKQRLKSLSDIPKNGTDFEGEKLRFEENQKEISRLQNEITEIKATLTAEFKNFEEPENIKREIAELTKIMDSQKEFCLVSQAALDILEESFAEVRRNYGSKLEKKTLSIFSRLTNGRYKGLNISKSLEITVEPSDSFGTREIDYLSQGTADQAYLSLRLAIAELIAENEPLPVILDDSLSQYDDTRLKEALAFLKEYSKNSQGILFTCHGFVKQSAAELDIPVLKL